MSRLQLRGPARRATRPFVRLADHFDVVLRVEQHAQALPDGLVILGEQRRGSSSWLGRRAAGRALATGAQIHRRALAGLRFDLQRRADQRGPLAHADDADALVAASSCSAKSKPTPLSSTTSTDRPSRVSSITSTRLAWACLEHVVQRLLGDAVERDLGFARRAARARSCAAVFDRNPVVLRTIRARSAAAPPRARDRRAPPAAAPRRGNRGRRRSAAPSTARSTTCSRRRVPASSCSLCPLERQAQRRELLAELIVQVAGDAGALVLLRGDDALQQIADVSAARPHAR